MYPIVVDICGDNVGDDESADRLRDDRISSDGYELIEFCKQGEHAGRIAEFTVIAWTGEEWV
jgi:hypothetical protein